MRETRIDVGGALLYTREVGAGGAIVVLHGGPDFDQAYLLPELDDLADSHRLIYYDQRGRGKSAEGVDPAHVTLASDVGDLERLRQHLELGTPVLLGHSWGAVLALEYALRHPTRVSHLVLMNPAPVSGRDLATMRSSYRAGLGGDMARQAEIIRSDAYRRGDPAAVAARYRTHFQAALSSPEHYEKLMLRMTDAFRSQGAAGILKARAVEDQLMRDTWERADYNLLPSLADLRVPALIVTGENDSIPVEVSRHIADALPRSTLIVLEGCGHFAYLERPAAVRGALNDFLGQ